MLKIQRTSDLGVVLSLSGRIEAEELAELQRLLGLEAARQGIALDLRDITLVDRDAVRFLAQCKADGIELANCPAYIREWIDIGRGRSSRPKTVNGRTGPTMVHYFCDREEDCNGVERSCFPEAASRVNQLA